MLRDICLQQISLEIKLDNAIELFELADHLIMDELKINCLKFISLNLVSFLESTYLERLLSLPIYLIRDLENFIKISDYFKYQLCSMHVVEDIEAWSRNNNTNS
jgi:hypothetical protein